MQHRTALELASSIRAREISPSEVMEHTLTVVERRNGAVNAVVWIDEEDARARARAATDKLTSLPADQLPPFLGVPIPVKDLYDVAGWPNTYGSTGASDAPVEGTALPVQRLVEAGFVLCGRTNSPEFGSITATENARYGITRNPWDPRHTSGGSSGGASSAVAAGMFTIAHASDGGGSIRIPASCTGLVGLKPARGRITDRRASWEGASTQGVVTNSVADTAAALDVMSRFDPGAWYNAPPPERAFAEEVGRDPGRLRVAVAITGATGFETDPECAAAAERTAEALAGLGHEVVDTAFEAHIDAFIAHFGEVVNGGLGLNPVDWEAVEPHNRAGWEGAGRISSLDYVRGVAALQEWTRDVNGQWGRDFDVLVTPTMIVQPPRAGQVTDELAARPGEISPTVISMILFTSIFNMSGLPAISLPLHQAADTGLPIGVQVVGGPWQEARLLQVASQLEQALPWADRRADVEALT